MNYFYTIPPNKSISKQIVYLFWDCIYYGFVDLEKVKEYKKSLDNCDEQNINSKIIIDNLVLSYQYGDDDELLSLSCYDPEEKRKIFDWNWHDFCGYRAPNYNFADSYILKEINEYLKNCIKKQDHWFFIKQKLINIVFDIAQIFYIDKPKHPVEKKIWWVYNTLWDIGVDMNSQLGERVKQ